MKISEYFAGVMNDTLFETISDNELKMHARVYNHYSFWRQLSEACWQAIRAHGNDELVDRKQLGNLMGEAMEILLATEDKRAPRPWVIVMRTLRKGGSIQRIGKTERT